MDNNKINQYINEYYDKKSDNSFDADKLFRLVEEAMAEAETPLAEATIRSSRLFYYVRADKLPKSIIKKIQEWYPKTANVESNQLIKSLNNRLFVEQQLEGNLATFKFYLSVDGDVTRDDIAIANRKKERIGEMKEARYLGDYSKEVQVAKTSISWLQTKPEELRAENEHLSIIKEKFKLAGISEESPVTITIKGATGFKTIDNVASIEKMKNKTAVGDFGLYDPEGTLLFSISHKAIGFERYAALISTLKALSEEDKVASTLFINAAEKKWKEGVMGNERSSKGYYEKITDTDVVQETVYLIYGKTADKADALFVGEIDLTKAQNDTFQLSVAPQESTAGNSAAYLYPEIPKEESYMPIFRSRFGSGGSKVGFTPEEIQTINEYIKDENNPLSVESLNEMKIKFDSNPIPGTDEIIIDNVFINVRWYISPMRRNDGGEEINSKELLGASDSVKGENIDKSVQEVVDGDHYENGEEHKFTLESLNNMIKEEIYRRVDKTFINEPELDYEDLFEEFERRMLSSEPKELVSEERLDVDSGKDSLTIKLPKFVVTEDWGKPDSEAFEHIRPFVLRAAGKGSTYEEKFAHFQSMFKGKDSKVTSVGRIIATLILLESWAAVLQQFGASSAGFLFESFLAALTFGEQVSDKDEGSLPIEDIIAFGAGPDGQPASLKLLRPETEIKGSFKNLVTYFIKRKSIDYIVAYKEGADSAAAAEGNVTLRIEKYRLTRENLIPFFLAFNSLGKPGNRNKKLIAPDITLDHKVFQHLGKNPSLDERVDALQSLSWSNLLKYFQDLFTLGGTAYDAENKKTQWYITQSQWRDGLDTTSLATIDLRRETIEKMNKYWATKLGSHVTEVFTHVSELSENINKYFLNPDRERAKSINGTRAISNTKAVKRSIDGTMASEKSGDIDI